MRETYDKLRSEHGFRMTDYKAEAEMAAAAPVPAVLRELSPAARSTSPSSSPSTARIRRASRPRASSCASTASATASATRCRSAPGCLRRLNEELTKTIEIAVYVPDRKPSVRFSGKSYVLPSRGQQGIPLVSINTAKVEVEVYRIGDRNLVGALESGDFQRQLQGYELEQIKARTGDKVFTGSMDVREKLNEEITTALPRHRSRRHAEARRLRDDRQAVAEVARGLQHRGDAVVHRLRPRPHRLLRR